MLALILAVIGGVGAMIGGLAWWRNWQSRIWGQLIFWMGLITAIGAFQVWDYESRGSDWRLSNDQKIALLQFTDRKNQDKFPVAFFSTNGESLAQRYVHDLMEPFIKNGWQYIYVYPNWVRPDHAFGVDIRTCGKKEVAEKVKNRIWAHVRALDYIFSMSKISVTSAGNTEEFLSDSAPHYTITAYRRPLCTVGIVVGQPPDPCHRVNPSWQSFPNIWCKVRHGTW